MLISPDLRIVISNLGWVDKSALWTYDTAKDSQALIPLGDAKYLSLYRCKDPARFAVLHHYDGPRILLSVHAYEDPSRRLCSIERTEASSSVQGDLTALESAPRYYAAYFDPGQAGDYYLLRPDAEQHEWQAERFDWFDQTYDKAYQGIVGLLELPDGNLVISIQRDSHPVVYDPRSRKVLRKLSLADRYGNPSLLLSIRRSEIWADDYDTLLKLDVNSLNVTRSRRIQAMNGSLSQFIGRWSLNQDESLCLVPRPFNGDVVALDAENLKTRYIARLNKQPLEAVALNDSRVVARDWTTGQLLKGSLRRAWFA